MVIDHHFGFIAFSWLAGIIGFAGLAFWIWRDRRALDRQLAELEAQGVDVSRAKDAS
jgi:heme exporter protein CcmD